MKTFKDGLGREWIIDRGGFGFTLERVESETGFNLIELAQAASNPDVMKTIQSPPKMVKILTAVARPQFVEEKIDDKAFAAGMYDMDAIELATIALMECVSDFLPRRQRQTAKHLVELVRLEKDRAVAELEMVNAKTAAKIAELRAETSGSPTGDSAA